MSSDLVSASAPQISRRMLGLAGGVALFTPAILFLPLREARAQARSAYDLISSAPAVSGFAQIIKTHGMEDAFQAPGEFGFFVPVNTALERTSPMQLERFRTDKEFARQILLNHITDYDGLVSAFIGQGDVVVKGNPELEKRIQSIVSSGDEQVSYSETAEKLQTWQRKRRYQPTGRCSGQRDGQPAIRW